MLLSGTESLLPAALVRNAVLMSVWQSELTAARTPVLLGAITCGAAIFFGCDEESRSEACERRAHDRGAQRGGPGFRVAVPRLKNP